MTRSNITLLIFCVMLLIILFLTGCSASWHLRQAEKKGASIKADTVFVDKQVIIDSVHTDTVFQAKAGDTVRIKKERLKIKYVKLPGDSVFIEGKCEADTVTIQVPVTIEKTIKAGKSFWDFWPWIFGAFAAGAILGIWKRR